MDTYSLHTEGDAWSIVDEATQNTARIDGVEMSAMTAEEARQILKILKSAESMRRISIRSSAAAKKLAKSVPASGSRKPSTRR